jgi:predicted ATPase/signal transduction histidine kinase/tRNA A-37 threonylcarbamoyl transferase component Bud32
MIPASTYTITQLLSRGGSATLYRAVRDTDRRPVVLKVLDARLSRPKDVERLKHEYEIGKLVDSPAVVKPLALETYQGMPALVLEDFDGQSLDELLGTPMATGRFLPLAISIAGAVADIHQQGIVHKDLKPHNILMNLGTGEVKVGDFGLASCLSSKHLPTQPARLIEGSLPYLSPEQTGRTNRAIDERTDLYSLGVTFHQMLTGRLPFEARDPVEWVHCHIARVPPSPSAIVAEVPETISRIVLKLLSKMPEDRYQSAHGLHHDLERCLEQWSSHGRVEGFALGERDAAGRLQIPQKLYGRAAEIALVHEAFGRVVATGTPELLLVSGYSGIGKSTLVQELYPPVARERGFFVSGKFDQYKRDIPYSTIVQAFRELVLQILAESEERIASFRQRLLDALGINAQLIVGVIPPVELIIDRQPPVAELPPTEAQNRFRIVFRHFIGVFAQREHPLALFVDDLQWADSASLALFQDLLTHPEMHHLFIVGAYRDNEVSPSHPLMLTLDEARKAGARTSSIVLGPLSREHLASLIRDALHCSRDEAEPLSDLVEEKTAGNPFFAIQLLMALHEEHLIELDRRTGAFRWDLAKIRAKGFTDNVVDLMVGKLRRLPAATQEALKQLACLGNGAEISILKVVLDRSEEETHADLAEAVRIGVLLRLDGTYKLLHDRVQEAAYSLIPEEQRAEVHLRIGRLLRSHLPGDALEERLFDVANQLNRGGTLITDPHEKEALCRLNFLAGTKAKAAIAYASAQTYLAQAMTLLPPDAWSARYEDTLALHLERSECEYLLCNFQQADDLCDLILQNARSNLDRARACRLRMRLYQVSGRYDDGMTVGFEALRVFGVTLPESDAEIQAAVEAEHRDISANLRGRRIADLVDAPVAKDPDVRAIICLLVDSAPSAYIARPKMFPLLSMKAVSFSLRFGNTEESCYGYSVYGLILVSVFGDIASGFEFSEMSLRLNEKFDDPRLRGTLLHLHGDHINPWRRHIATDLPILERAFRACLEVGDLVYASALAFQTVWQTVEKGDPLDEVLEVSRKYIAFAKQSHNDAVYETLRLEQQFVANLKGATRGPSSFDDAGFDESASLGVITRATFGCGVVFYHIMKQIVAFIHGRYTEALESAARAATMLDAAMAMPIEATYHFYLALTLAALYPQAPAAQQQEFARTLQQELQKLERWANHCPENHRNRHALVLAEVARVEGRELDAERLYEEAIQSAGENGFCQNEALACELAAGFHQGRGFHRIADTYWREARACYARWGADGKVRQLDERHRRLGEVKPLAPTATLAVRTEQLDLLSVVKASQTVSGEIVLDKLLRTLLTVVLEQGGAQRGCLILCRDGSLSIEAEASLEGGGEVATKILESLPVSSSPLVPAAIINYVVRTKERVILDDAAQASKYALDPYVARVKPRSLLCLPILRQAEVVGLLYLENNLVTGTFTPERLASLSLLASQAAISLENALLLSKEQAARTAAEEAERHAAFLAEAGEILSESLDCAETLARLGRLSVRSLCEWCVIDIVEDGVIRRIAGAHRDPAKEPLLEELQRRYPPRWDSPHPATTVLRSGEPLLMTEMPDELLRPRCVDDEHIRLLRALGTQSGLSVPLVARGQTLGALTVLSSASGHRFGSADLERVQEVAHRAAIAIDNAMLYRASQEAVRAREEFLAVASHELNTPVTSLTLNLQSMQRAIRAGRAVDPQTMGRLVERALRQAARLTRLNSDLLDVSRIHTDQLLLDLADVDLGGLVRDVVDQFKPELSRAGSSVTLRGSGRVVGHWDRSRIEQILANLLSNASKFGAGKPIEVSFGVEAGIARLAVRDHGIGIDPAQQDRIFERFERAASMNYGGLGLGLYVSRRIAEAHGGALRVQSTPGAGATFILELPCAGPP